MKVAIITPSLSGRGGEETVISEIMRSKKLRLNGLQIQLIILGKSYDKHWLSEFSSLVKITNTENEIKNFIYLIRMIRQEKYQKIICLSRKSILYSYLIRKVLVDNYSIYSWIHFDLEKVNIRFLGLADFHLAISDGIHDQLIAKKIGNKNNIFTIYNPVSPHKEVINRTFANKLVYVGRITYRGPKDIKELIDNVAHLPFTNWSLRIIGDGREKEKCQKYLLRYYPAIKNNIVWEGWQKDPWSSIHSADALVLTSSDEGLGMVLLEAISRGLPCLSTAIDGPTSIIRSSINGELYRKGNKNDFSIKLQKIFKTNYNTHLMKKSISKFYVDAYLNKFMDILREENKQR